MRLPGKILALTGLLLLTIVYLPVSVPATAPCSNIARPGYGLLSFFLPSVAACPGPDFTISANPSSLTVSPGGKGTSSIVLNSLFNFNGTVSLSTSPSPACAAPGCASWSISPVSVSLGPNGTATSTFAVYVSINAVPGSSGNVTVFGSNGVVTKSVVVTVTTGPPTSDFSMSANPLSQTVQPGATTTYKIVLTSINGFSGNVNLATPMVPCLTYCWTLDPIAVHLAAGGTNSSILTITTTTGIKPGNYSLPVQGFGGGLSHQITVYFSVPFPPDFAMSASPASQTVQPGSTIISTIILSSVGGFSGTVILGGPLVLCTSYCWSLNPAPVNIPAGGTNSSTLTITTQTTIKPGNYSVTIGGSSGNLNHSVTVYFTVPSPNGPDFAISASNQTPIIQQGSSETSTLTVSSIGGFQGTVSLVAFLNHNSSSSPQLAVNPSSVSLTPNGSATSTLTISTTSSTTLGNYTVIVQGNSGSLTHRVNVALSVVSQSGPPDFSLATSSGNLTINQGQTATATLALTSLHGFQGAVNLVASLNCTGIACPSISVSPASLSLAPNGTATSTLTVSASASTTVATFTVTLTATSGSISHSIVVTVTVLDPPASGAGGGSGRRFF